MVDSFLQRAHRKKRKWYYTKGREHLLHSHNHVLLACDACHKVIENDSELTEKVFIRLRGELIDV